MATERVTDHNLFKKVLGILPAKLELLHFVDGEGNDEVRLAVTIGNKHYLFRKTVGHELLIQPCQEWLENEISTKTSVESSTDGP